MIMLGYILAIASLTHMDENAPKAVQWFEAREGCMTEATKQNQTNEKLRDQEARELGLEFVCLKVERAQID